MVCKISCLVTLSFLVAKIYMMMSVDHSSLMGSLTNTLSEEQLMKYKNIVNERRNIYMRGYYLGLALSVVALTLNYTSQSKNRLSKLQMVCTSGAIVFTTSYFHYIISPKSDWMVNHLENEQQVKAWNKIYRTMQLRYHIGFVLGIFASLTLSNAMCNCN